MAGQGLLSGLWRGGLPCLCGKAGGSRGKRFGEPVSCHRRPVAPEKNGTLLPSAVSPYSNRRVWWRDELGHVWQATVSARTQHGSGCPYCSGKTALPGFNDLATLAPEVAAQWHPTLNGTLTPDQVTAGSHRTAWWECPSGHIWKAIVYSRAGPQKCGSRLCRQSPPGAPETLPTGTGGDGIKTGPVSQFPAQK